MKANYVKAMNELKAIGVPCYEGGWDGEDTFRISGEDNYGDEVWADYYEEYTPSSWEFGVNPKITKILAKRKLYAEWVNPGVLNVYSI